MRDHIHSKIYYEVDDFMEKVSLSNLKTVWTNGCFDLLHPGHLYSLSYARSLGDYLIVGLNDDKSVQQLKGSSRPIIREEDRAFSLASLSYVDAVIVFGGETPMHVLDKIQPHIFAKGAEYNVHELPEGALVKSYGGQLTSIPMLGDYSTSEIVKKMRS